MLNNINNDEFVSIENIKNLSFKDLVEKFNYYNSLNICEFILLYGTNLLLDYNKRLGNKKWDIMESILICTFRYKIKDNNIINNEQDKILKWQKYCLQELKKKFGDDFKFKKLLGMFYESKGEYEKSLDIYKKLLRFDPEDLQLRRNIISILMNKKSDIIDEHLKECIMDVECWKIKSYYLLTNTNDYHYALYCMEEVLLHEPQNINVINIIADLYFILGNIEMSRKYFCLTINIKKNNLRALWGILQCNSIKYNKKINNEDSNNFNNKDLSEIVIKNLIEIYSNLENNKNKDRKDDLNENKRINITPSMIASRVIDYYNNKIRLLL